MRKSEKIKGCVSIFEKLKLGHAAEREFELDLNLIGHE